MKPIKGQIKIALDEVPGERIELDKNITISNKKNMPFMIVIPKGKEIWREKK